jgi:hypothetical protein
MLSEQKRYQTTRPKSLTLQIELLKAKAAPYLGKEISHKRVISKRATFTKAEREYVKGVVHNLSLQRLTDQEIVDWLREEKKIGLDRSTISKMRNHVEQQAEKWYIELKESRYKYIANYKARLDSLLSYQKKLNQIIEFYLQPPMQILYPDTIIKAVAELHRIEVLMFNIWKQLPDLDIIDKVKQQKEENHNQKSQKLTYTLFDNSYHRYVIA